MVGAESNRRNCMHRVVNRDEIGLRLLAAAHALERHDADGLRAVLAPSHQQRPHNREGAHLYHTEGHTDDAARRSMTQ